MPTVEKIVCVELSPINAPADNSVDVRRERAQFQLCLDEESALDLNLPEFCPNAPGIQTVLVTYSEPRKLISTPEKRITCYTRLRSDF